MVEITDFKGKPVLVLRRSEGDRFPFAFGLGKARLILEHLEEIKKFVQDNSKK